jgi:molybdenum cofactor cytidylyltransferase
VRFGPVPVAEAAGSTAVHTVRTQDLLLKKGTLITLEHIAALQAAGVPEVVVARLEPGDVPEDIAAGRIAEKLVGTNVRAERAFTGRANLFATAPGVLIVDGGVVDRINAIDESVTLATLPSYRAVVEGEMIATVKIIPFAVTGATLERVLDPAESGEPVVRVAPYQVRRVGVISTLLPGLAPKVIDKTIRITADRLAPTGAAIIDQQTIPHEPSALTTAIEESIAKGAELLLVFGASAIADRRDVIPSAIEAAGGRIEHFGMPVDPGNLLLVGDVKGNPVLGAPGCARSPKENGFDWVLARLLARLPVRREDIVGMGVGGLLMEIVTRPQPRLEPPPPASPRVAALVLAAGQSRRMGGPNKLMAEIKGKPLARIVVEQVLASKADPVVVVTGHQPERMREALQGLKVSWQHNPAYDAGLSTSLRAGIAALPPESDAVIVCLADMPRVSSGLIDRLIDAYEPERGALIVVPTFQGKRGNPVLWPRRLFAELMAVEGDVGAKHLIGQHGEGVTEVAVDDAAIFFDIDTPAALAEAGRAAPNK